MGIKEIKKGKKAASPKKKAEATILSLFSLSLRVELSTELNPGVEIKAKLEGF